MDPPYDRKLVNSTIDLILENDLISPAGRIVIEHSGNEKIAEKWLNNIISTKCSGKTNLTILKFSS